METNDQGNFEEQKQVDVEKADLNQEASFAMHKKQVRQQRIALTSISVFAVIILVVGFLRFNTLIDVPWGPIWSTGSDVVISNDSESVYDDDPDELRAKDTDEDGINDFDEIYVYHTSAYLADSDSDGINDYDEIIGDLDPNCPEGQSCFATYTEEGAVSGTQVVKEIIETNPVLQVTADELRDALLQSGVITPEELAQYDDELLLELYETSIADNPEVLDQVELEDVTGQGLNPAGGNSIDEIKEALLKVGISESEMEQFSDAELIEIYDEVLDTISAAQSEN
jgi:hypothetical protein